MTITNLTPPVISGTYRNGQTLHTTDGTWTSDDPLAFDYQWYRCDDAGLNCVQINGANGQNYLVTPSDIGSRLKSRVSATEVPISLDLPFSAPTLSNPIQPSLASLSGSSFACNTGADYLIDLDWAPRSNTLILTGSPRRVIIKNSYFRITTPTSSSPYSRGGLGLQLKAEHVYVENYFCQANHAGATQTDGFRNASLNTTKLTLQRARIEGMTDTPEAAEHCDAFQVQGPVGEIEIGLVTAWAPGVRPGNDGGKCFQIAHEAPAGFGTPAPFDVHMRKVNMVGVGTGTARFGTMLIRGPRNHHNTGVFYGNIGMTLEDVWQIKAGNSLGDFPAWHYVYTYGSQSDPTGSISGSAPNRIATFIPAQGITNSTGGNGIIREGRPNGVDFVPRSLLEAEGLSIVA